MVVAVLIGIGAAPAAGAACPEFNCFKSSYQSLPDAFPSDANALTYCCLNPDAGNSCEFISSRSKQVQQDPLLQYSLLKDPDSDTLFSSPVSSAVSNDLRSKRTAALLPYPLNIQDRLYLSNLTFIS